MRFAQKTAITLMSLRTKKLLRLRLCHPHARQADTYSDINYTQSKTTPALIPIAHKEKTPLTHHVTHTQYKPLYTNNHIEIL